MYVLVKIQWWKEVDCVGVSSSRRGVGGNSSIRLPGDRGVRDGRIDHTIHGAAHDNDHRDHGKCRWHQSLWHRWKRVQTKLKFWLNFPKQIISIGRRSEVMLPRMIRTRAKQFICLIKVGEQQTEQGCSVHLWEQDNLLKAAQRGMLWSTYWGFDYHRWAVAGPWWAQGWPPSSSSSSPALCHKTWVRIVHAGLPLLWGLILQDPKSLGAVLAGWVLSARRGKGEWGHGAKGDESGGHPWGDKITLYSHQITRLTTLLKIYLSSQWYFEF